ncbi:hypothetical protein ABEB36_001362 [Hypothenemus hampei]|uniref:Uncharacterized protein n=1 Tax=Hypothenemus hampei TaxID=57062 RepID=A0ABD1FHW0_HYPHA
MSNRRPESAEEPEDEFVKYFCQIASMQGRIAYCLMSLYSVNPSILNYFISTDLHPFLMWNMIYGITVMIISRPCLKSLMPVHQFSFSLLGSLAFNYSSLLWYQWLNSYLDEQTILRTILGYISGRVMMVHLLAFLYHIDTRCSNIGDRSRRLSAFEVMYL